MRVRQALPAALLLALGLAAPATAVDVGVQAVDYEFMPKALKIAPGDSVTWTFSGESEHTATSVRGQAERFSSGLETAGGTYTHTFVKPGRFQYICLPHRFTMKGTVQVGDDAARKSFTGVKTTVSGKRATSRLTLLEAATVTAVVDEPKRRRVSLAREQAGPIKIAWGTGLKPGRYEARITAVDDFDVKTVKKVGFKIAE